MLAKVAPEVSLPIGGSTALTLRFSELDDFHPDRLFEQAGCFAGCERCVRDSILLPSQRLPKSWV